MFTDLQVDSIVISDCDIQVICAIGHLEEPGVLGLTSA